MFCYGPKRYLRNYWADLPVGCIVESIALLNRQKYGSDQNQISKIWFQSNLSLHETVKKWFRSWIKSSKNDFDQGFSDLLANLSNAMILTKDDNRQIQPDIALDHDGTFGLEHQKIFLHPITWGDVDRAIACPDSGILNFPYLFSPTSIFFI